MAKEKVKTPLASDESLGALRARVGAILHSNGFDGTKAAGEISTAVGEFLGVEVAPKAEEEKTEE